MSSTGRSSSGARPCSASAPGRSACSSRYVGEADVAFGAPRSRRRPAARSASALTALRLELEPYLLNDGGSLALAGIPGEYLTFTNPKGQVVPWLATSWKPNNDRDRLDVPAPQGRQVPQRQDDDLGGRRRQHEAVRRGEGVERAALSPFFDAAGVSKTGPYTVLFRLKSPIGAFPYLVSQTTYQAIIQPAAIAAKPGTWVDERDDRHRRVQAQELRRRSRAPSSCATTPTGAASRRSTA